MKKYCDDLFTRDLNKIYRRENIPQGKANTLLDDLLEKEEQITAYKNRLKELEAAFYYNLDIIAERDLELSVLEKQLSSENEQLQEVIRERNELEDLVKIIDEKNNRKIQQLEMKLSLKEKEIINLQRENVTNVNTLKRLIGNLKQQQQKKINKMATNFEIHKDEIIKGCREEVEKKEKYYLLEIDNLNGKLEQVRREKDRLEEAAQENKNLKYHLQDVERLFLEKENQYLQEIKKLTFSQTRKVNTEVQCDLKLQGVEIITQTQPDMTTAFAQTGRHVTDSEEEYIQKINFLQEQNEVLKYIVKDLKKNRNAEPTPEDPGELPGCECLALRTELEQVNKKFENEISNLKKILEEERNQRKEEDVMIQSLEASVCCLKDKLLSGLQDKLNDFAGGDICTYTYNREIQNEIQVTLLEQKLSKKIDALVSTSEDERQKLHGKLEELKKECLDQIEAHLKPTELKSENLLEKIRLEIQKLENKIETDMRNVVKNNCEKDKCDKNFQTHPDTRRILNPKSLPEVLPSIQNDPRQRFCNSTDSCRVYYRNDISHEKCIGILKYNRGDCFRNRNNKTGGEARGFRDPTNRFVTNRNDVVVTSSLRKSKQLLQQFQCSILGIFHSGNSLSGRFETGNSIFALMNVKQSPTYD